MDQYLLETPYDAANFNALLDIYDVLNNYVKIWWTPLLAFNICTPRQYEKPTST